MMLEKPPRVCPHTNTPRPRHVAWVVLALVPFLCLSMAWGDTARSHVPGGPNQADGALERTPGDTPAQESMAEEIPGRDHASEPPAGSDTPHEPPRFFSVDLDGDGEKETVSLVRQSVPDRAGATLRVSDSRGGILWESTPDQSDFHFFSDIYWPSVIGDVDGDGRIELLAGEPLFDVSPRSFFLARWQDGAFRPVSSGWSLIEQSQGGGGFKKVLYAYDGNPVTWIMDVESLEGNGELIVTVYQDSEDRMRQGTAALCMHGDMGRIVRWIRPLH